MAVKKLSAAQTTALLAFTGDDRGQLHSGSGTSLATAEALESKGLVQFTYRIPGDQTAGFAYRRYTRWGIALTDDGRYYMRLAVQEREAQS